MQPEVRSVSQVWLGLNMSPTKAEVNLSNFISQPNLSLNNPTDSMKKVVWVVHRLHEKSSLGCSGLTQVATLLGTAHLVGLAMNGTWFRNYIDRTILVTTHHFSHKIWTTILLICTNLWTEPLGYKFHWINTSHMYKLMDELLGIWI